MKTGRTVWGIDVGPDALRAMRVRDVEGQAQADAVRIVPLGGGGSREASLAALGEFAGRADLSDCHVAVAIPGTHACSRCVQLPPVHDLDLPEVVQFEATQQLPPGLEKVTWQWQTFRDLEDVHGGNVVLGLFAVDRTDVGQTLLLFAEAGINVDIMQLRPLALYNFMMIDAPQAPRGATFLADLDAARLDMVIADGRMIWFRTADLASAQPTADDLAGEARRTIDEYAASHGQANFDRLLAAGEGLRSPALAEAMGERLGVPAARVEGFAALKASASLEASALKDSAASLAAAYGLAMQGLGRAPVHANFLPAGISRRRRWAGQSPHKFLAWLKEVLPSLFE